VVSVGEQSEWQLVLLRKLLCDASLLMETPSTIDAALLKIRKSIAERARLFRTARRIVFG